MFKVFWDWSPYHAPLPSFGICCARRPRRGRSSTANCPAGAAQKMLGGVSCLTLFTLSQFLYIFKFPSISMFRQLRSPLYTNTDFLFFIFFMFLCFEPWHRAAAKVNVPIKEMYPQLLHHQRVHSRNHNLRPMAFAKWTGPVPSRPNTLRMSVIG